MTRNYLSQFKQRLTADRGQVGIGTLIVFIAMVLVAAIAAGVLINTAGFLQTKSEQTGQESSAQVSNRVQVVSGFGNVANEEVNYINLTVMRGSGSDDINLSSATIEWLGPNEAKTLVSGSEDDMNAYNLGGNSKSNPGETANFTVKSIKDPDDSVPVLDEQDDRFKISLNSTAISGQRLSEGQTVELKLTTQYGAVTIYRANIPQSLSQESAVTV
ncbi:archaellin/type IV pilin N-terminal domain-containing protein [Halorussus halophilus]|uniref:archaellin/type IV pilin N-terminal domain-containing protein n=1 Tax=Halorussus halophilus TaxID=2650975 RepID=UPI0013010F1F|nr:archaellin/type IV pilin N-terminal domain-containing protein [Halorussus halophilus]